LFFSIAKSYIVVLFINTENFKLISGGNPENQQYENSPFDRSLSKFRFKKSFVSNYWFSKLPPVIDLKLSGFIIKTTMKL
jgi:hypothetical protein